MFSIWFSFSNVESKVVTPNALVTPFKPTGCPGLFGIWNVPVNVPAMRLSRVYGSTNVDR